jgi:uncharacterized protein (TIGR03086 family)
VVSVSCTPVALLERSVDYALGGIGTVEPSMLHRQTPCSEWDLRDLLFHLTESMLTLSQLLGGSGGTTAAHRCPAAATTDAALDLRRTVASVDADVIDSTPRIGGVPIPRRMIVLTGALEVAIHAWDVGQACKSARPMPAELAQDLLPRAPLLLDSTARRDLFADPIKPALGATAAERLVALAGRMLTVGPPGDCRPRYGQQP